MEKKTNNFPTNNGSSESLGVCQKLFSAIRRISSGSRQPSPAPTHNSHRPGRTIEIQNGASTVQNDVVLVPDIRKPKGVDQEISSQKKLVLIEGPTNGDNKKNPDKETDHHHHHHQHHLNKTFEEYINRMWYKIRRDSDVDHGDHEKKMTSVSETERVIKKKGSFKDHISDYIHRTKFKMSSHSSSSLGSSSNNTTTTGKSVSFKTEY